MINKILTFKDFFYRPKGALEGLEFYKACKDKQGLNKCFSAIDTEAFRDLVLIYGLKHPKHLDSIQGFIEFVGSVKVNKK